MWIGFVSLRIAQMDLGFLMDSAGRHVRGARLIFYWKVWCVCVCVCDGQVLHESTSRVFMKNDFPHSAVRREGRKGVRLLELQSCISAA